MQRLCRADPAPIPGSADLSPAFCRTAAGDLRRSVTAAWGEPVAAGGVFGLRHAILGRLVVAVQPDRGSALDRKATYHDPDLPPCHAYVAFYLWLRRVLEVDALVHLGTHGTLEWLPGKSVALSAACTPVALAGGLPVIYPFIVNNPGEAAAAKRRLGAVTIGHLTPPLKAAGSHGAAAELERLIDEFAAADGLDSRRAALLRREILTQADTAGLLGESGVRATRRTTRRSPGSTPISAMSKTCRSATVCMCSGGARAGAPGRCWTRLLRASPGARDRCGSTPAPAPNARRCWRRWMAAFVPPGPAGAPTPRPRRRAAHRAEPVHHRSARGADPLGARPRRARGDELLRRHLQDQGE